ncbi:hypothetical protein [Streptococcus pantholopis]|uniref:Uncharacterized protein n=1 Tax=Streptococcus pantholopis TaxID=1811193 RepID=A0A172Q4Z7_9STRE|nr:hypothetical protein [Streptococcus pantholopis]AND78531.1 hypothetical protein A0O21_00100 [Streptococcus pantholopis]
MTFRFKKWQLIFLIIPVIIIFGIVKSQIDSQTSKDGTYYLVVENYSTMTASLDKTSWIKIEDDQLIINEDDSETSYDYDVDKEEFEKDSMTYFCLFNEGILTIGTHDDDSTETTTYVSPKSNMYSGYEDGTVKISK